MSTSSLAQSFDGVAAPVLPSGWATTTVSGTAAGWVTTADAYDTAPNAAFDTDSSSVGLNALVSPVIPVVSSSAQLTFRQNYNLEAHTARRRGITYYDGGVIEIQIGTAGFTDILAAGGSFVSGGYNGAITSSSDNPLPGRQAWVGNSGGWLTTTVNLPAAAAGQNVQFQWVSATDGGNYYGGVGWYVDTVSLQDGYYTCCSDTADLAVSQVTSPSALLAGQDLTFIVTITNAGPGLAAGVSITDVLPAGVSFVSGTPGSSYAAGSVVWPLGLLLSGALSNVTVTVTPITTGPFTNTVRVDSATPDPNPINDTATLVVDTNAPVVIATQPGSQVVAAGATAGFQVTAEGAAPLSYQWFFNGTNALVGATAAMLTLTNVQPGQAGGYSVVVSSMDGTVTSAVATLRVLVPPTLDVAGLPVTGSHVSLSLLSVSGLNYTLEFTTSLTAPSWTPLPPAVPGTGGTITLEDTNAVPAEGSRFYRILCN